MATYQGEIFSLLSLHDGDDAQRLPHNYDASLLATNSVVCDRKNLNLSVNLLIAEPVNGTRNIRKLNTNLITVEPVNGTRNIRKLNTNLITVEPINGTRNKRNYNVNIVNLSTNNGRRDQLKTVGFLPGEEINTTITLTTAAPRTFPLEVSWTKKL